MASFDDIIASILDSENVGKKSYMPKQSRPALPSSKHLDEVHPFEKYDDNATTNEKLRKGARTIPENKVFRDPPIPPEETNDRNVINPDKSPFMEYWNNESIRDNARFRTSRKA